MANHAPSQSAFMNHPAVRWFEHRLPILSIDNQHAIPFFQHDDDIGFLVRRATAGIEDRAEQQ